MSVLLICIALLLSLSGIPTATADSDAAEDLTGLCTFDFGTNRDAKYILLNDPQAYQTFRSQTSFSMTWENPLESARLCIQWQTVPEDVRVLQYDADETLLTDETLSPYYETITPLLPEARKAVVQAGETDMRLISVAVYGAGELPEPFHEWQETPDHLDYLLISSHPDDDVLYLGSIVPTYGAERGYVGTIIYVTASTRRRVSEAENGAWAMGLRCRPVFFGMQDMGRYVSKQQRQSFPYAELVKKTVRAYRSMRPVVVFAQDLKGEYGHWMHKLTAKAAREAFRLAADPDYDPESAEQYGTWQVQKLFLHLYKENKLMIEAHAPLQFFDGLDAYEVACKAYKKHVSQQRFHFRVTRDNKKNAFNRFGMAEGVVPVGEDVFDQIDETLLSDYVPPTPEPTAEPTPKPSETPDPVLTAKPTPTAAPSGSPAPEQGRIAFDPVPLYRIAAVTAAAALVAGIVAFAVSKRYLRRNRHDS